MTKVLTFGVFDYFHIGHLNLLRQCREHGDYLIVGVQNGEYVARFKPAQSMLYTTNERVTMIEALRIVDEVVTYEAISPEFLKEIDFDVLALGEDHTSERFLVSAKWCVENGKEVVRMKRTPKICSSNIKKNI
jgi:glycerol-3-phosphate cytidylyltransferase